MNPIPTLHPAIVPPGQNPAIHAFGEEVVFHLTGEQTGGAFTQWVETTPPGAGPPPHWHTNEDEWRGSWSRPFHFPAALRSTGVTPFHHYYGGSDCCPVPLARVPARTALNAST